MKTEHHKKYLKESLTEIEESIEKGIEQKQRTIGFNTSAAAADLLEIYLHKQNLIDPGFIIKHEWLKSKNKIKEKLPFEFPKKKEILEIIYKIEEKRNALCYGKPQEIETLQEHIKNFKELREIMLEVGVNAE